MKKYTFIISILILSIILAFPGCGGGGKKDGGNGGIKIYESLGGVAYMPENLNVSGIAFADSLSEIGNEYIYFVGNNSEAVVPTIMAYYKDGNGNTVDTPVVFAIEGDNCFNMENLQNLSGGGSAFNLVGVAPGGRAKLTATANGQTREIDVYIYDSYGTLNTGLNIATKEFVLHTDASSTIYGDTSDIYTIRRLNKRSYAVPDGICDSITWKEKLKSIKTVDPTKFINGSENQALEGPECPQPQIFIAEAAGGGYIKVVKVGVSIVWEYSPTENFK
jgi:hypothetical protein